MHGPPGGSLTAEPRGPGHISGTAAPRWPTFQCGSGFLSSICWPFGPLSHWHAFQVCIHEWHQLLLGWLRSSWKFIPVLCCQPQPKL
uniref:Rho/Rac guanine nucleotide exchange factor 2 n=1 Tax=Molossus molossus TaxID=27622 RepID=A0A7J8CP86_MOLMO|nr:Rho/Rac guanine nucleotide exchange factor 2 [Molossus molossus]